jgi:hypothetical protein
MRTSKTMSAKNLITQAELIRLLNLPRPRVVRAIRQGLLSPDEIVSGRLQLFDRSRLPQIERLLLAQRPEVS